MQISSGIKNIKNRINSICKASNFLKISTFKEKNSKFQGKEENSFLKNFPNKNFSTQQVVVKKIDLNKVSVYKRITKDLGIPFNSKKSQVLLTESIEEGSGLAFFDIMDQFQTQGDPTFCGPTTLAVVLNSLGIDPHKKWKGIWRWYFEEVIKCLNIESVKKFGITMEELSIVAKCNGVFNECYRPDLDEEKTQKEISIKIRDLNNKKNSTDKEKTKKNELYSDIRDIFQHFPDDNHDCKHENLLKIKYANLDFFKVCAYSTTRRNKFILVANTSRKVLGQTGSGHFACVAALHEKSNNLLLMETARFKYNSMWFNLKNVYDSFFPLDSTTKETRGFMLCSKYFYLSPKPCKFSFDSKSANYAKELIIIMKNLFENEEIKTIEDYLKRFIEFSDMFNTMEIKSLLLYYYHDLENRTSFSFDNFKDKESYYINYLYENKNFEKENLFKMLNSIGDCELISEIIFRSFKENKDFREFITFLYYLTEENFIEFFIFFILSIMKYDFLKNNKFNLDLFSKDKEFCSTDNSDRKGDLEFKKFKEYKFNVCECPNETEKEININKKEKCEKIIYIEMENLRYHFGLY